jgi:AraC-like DNA-binding protein
MLIDGDQPITAVCHISGFGNLSNFNRVFQRLRRCTPRTYRRQYAVGLLDADAPFLRSRRTSETRQCRIRRFPAAPHT